LAQTLHRVLSNVYLDQRQATTRSPLHFRLAINNGHPQERSEYPKVPSNPDIALGAADALAEWRCG